MVTAANNSSADEAALLAAKLRRFAPTLQEYRHLLQDRFVSAATSGQWDEMAEYGHELIAYDRWRSFDLSRQTSCLQIVTGSQQ